MIYRAEHGILRAAEDIKAGDRLMIADRPAEPERWSACMGERPGIPTCHTMIYAQKVGKKCVVDQVQLSKFLLAEASSIYCLSLALPLTFYGVTTTVYYDPVLKSWK
jgi:hypothetical protein